MNFLSSSSLAARADTSVDTMLMPGNKNIIPTPAAADKIGSYPKNLPEIYPPNPRPNADNIIRATIDGSTDNTNIL